MASFFDALTKLLGQTPTDDQMRDPKLIDEASQLLQTERQKQWTPELKSAFGITGDTPKDQLKIDEANTKSMGDSENKG